VVLAVIADTHMPRGSRRLPEECVDRVRSAELTLHAGDFVAASVLDQLESLGTPLAAVHGNVDVPELEARLPARRIVEAAGVRIGLVHDAGPARGRFDRLRRQFPNVAAVVFGHSHMPCHEAGVDFQIFNPGSPTERRRSPHRTMGLVTVEPGAIAFEHVELA
jgi:putative phosphoesterase